MHRLVKTIFVILTYLILALGVEVSGAIAHEVRPGIVDVIVQKDGQIELQIKLNLEAVIAGIGAGDQDTDQSENSDKYDAIREYNPEKLKEEFDKTERSFLNALNLKSDGERLPLELSAIDVPTVGDVDLSRTTILKLKSTLPSGAKFFTWSWVEVLGSSVVRVKGKSSDGSAKTVFAAVVKGGAESKPIPLTGLVSISEFEVFTQYTVLGFEHIIPKGLDHILFVVGLFLLSAKLSSLLWQISSFTLAHTITLGLAMGGIVSAPSSIVEPLIALSIVFVAVENILTDNLHRWRPVVVFGFGLLHGLGFASVLNEIGLQPENFISGLLGFNLGVEFGQLAVILICFLLVGFWFSKKSYYRAYITNPASAAIAIIGAWWFVERVFL